MARDRNELGGALGGQSAGQGERLRRQAAEGTRAERDRVRQGKMTAASPRTRAAARKADSDETPRRPTRSTKNRAAAGSSKTRAKPPSDGAAGRGRAGAKPAGGRYGGVDPLGRRRTEKS